jgi:hypothetical protein
MVGSRASRPAEPGAQINGAGFESNHFIISSLLPIVVHYAFVHDGLEVRVFLDEYLAEGDVLA